MQVFISYSSSDQDFALRLANDLALYEVDIWIDDWAIKAGDSIPGSIQEGLASSDYVLVLVSSKALASNWTISEVNSALHRAISTGRPKVFPLLLDNCVLPPFLADRKSVTFVDAEAYQASLETLVMHLHQVSEQRGPPSLFIPGFREVKILGEGGFSTVYIATEVATGQLKAIKIPKGRVHLEREAQIVQKIQDHPGVVPIERTFAFKGRTVLVMPYSGKSLKWQIAHRKIKPQHLEQIAVWMRGLAEIMSHAHSKGVVHGDLKPGNVLIDEFGVLRIVDFGIAQTLEHVEFQKSTMVRGTLCYMSPEQWQGELPTPSSDIYAFGAMFYELATGERPIGRFQSARRINDQLDRSMDQLIDRCLETSPAKRFHEFSEIVSALNGANDVPRMLWSDEMLFVSEPMREVERQIQALAALDAPVLIQGETGTGKELVARRIAEAYLRGTRKTGAFIAVNCAALPETLFDAQLLGYVRGAFTGAAKDTDGFLAAASGGVLQLDEVAELPLSVQPKLLQVLRTRSYYPLGSTAARAVDVRVIASTDVDLEELVHRKLFRRDLFHCLGVTRIEVPPLRERKADVRVLATHFIQEACRQWLSKDVDFDIDADVLELMESQWWPGNVRQLRYVLERAVLLASDGGARITRAHISHGLDTAPPSLSEARQNAERQALSRAFAFADHSGQHPARILGISEAQLRSLIRRYEFDVPSDPIGRTRKRPKVTRRRRTDEPSSLDPDSEPE